MARGAQVIPQRTKPRSAASALESWSDDRLQELLERRPDLAAPPPRSFAELAERAVAAPSAEDAYHRVDRSAQQVVEVLTLLPPMAPIGYVAAIPFCLRKST